MNKQTSAKTSAGKPQHSMSKKGGTGSDAINAPKEGVGGPKTPGKPPENTPRNQRDEASKNNRSPRVSTVEKTKATPPLFAVKQIPPEERLEILRANDPARKWYALDDKRVCSVCNHVFSGRQVEISGDHGTGFILRCPTPGCSSDIRHWFLCEVSSARFSDPPLPKTGEVSFIDWEFEEK
jgi:hypothetical protein